MEIGDAGFIREGDQEIGYRGADAADHDTGDQQGCHGTDAAGKKEHEAGDDQGSQERSRHDGPVRSVHRSPDDEYHDCSDQHFCAV